MYIDFLNNSTYSIVEEKAKKSFSCWDTPTLSHEHFR